MKTKKEYISHLYLTLLSMGILVIMANMYLVYSNVHTTTLAQEVRIDIQEIKQKIVEISNSTTDPLEGTAETTMAYLIVIEPVTLSLVE